MLFIRRNMCLNVLWSDSKTSPPTQLLGNSQTTALSHTLSLSHTPSSNMYLSYVSAQGLSLSPSLTHTPHTRAAMSFSLTWVLEEDFGKIWRETGGCLIRPYNSFNQLADVPVERDIHMHCSRKDVWVLVLNARTQEQQQHLTERQTDKWFWMPCQQCLGKSTETDFVRTQYMIKKKKSTYHN